jgi:AcrR family transcriptional regulator
MRSSAQGGSSSKRPGGETARTRKAALDATLAELTASGYGGLSIDAVALRAGVHKTTLYRRWGSKQHLVVDAVRTFAAESVMAPDTGTVDEDLRLWARSILETITDTDSGAVVKVIVSGAMESVEVRDLLADFYATRLAAIVPVVDRAIQRGQLPDGTDAREVVRQVSAPLYYRLLLTTEPLTPEIADLAAEAALAAARAGVFLVGKAKAMGRR